MNFYLGAPRFLPPALTAHGLCLPRVQSPRPRHPGHTGQPRRGRRGVPDLRRGDRGQRHRRHVAGGSAASPIRSSSATATAARSPCAMSQTIRERRRWCCSRRIAAARTCVPLASKAGLLAGDRLRDHGTGHELVSEGRGRELLLLARLVVRDYRRKLPRSRETAPTSWSSHRAYMPDAVPARRPGAARPLSGRGICAPRKRTLCKVEIVPDCDHFYVGREDEIAKRVNMFIRTAIAVDTR